MNPLFKGFKSTTKPPDRLLPWQWCEKYLVVDQTSPMPGRFRTDNSPWVREPMEEFANNDVRDIAILCSAQSSKTQLILGCACWSIAEAPGPGLWVMAAKDEVEEFVRDRASPTFHGCKPVKERIISEGPRNFEFGGMPLYFVGAGSKSKLQSKPIRWLFLDEVRNYKKGALDTVLKRTRAFWNSRRVIISTPDKKDDAVDRAYKAGDQRVYHVQCPQCKNWNPLKFEQLKWTKDETTKPNGKWDFDRLAETIRYECKDCGHVTRDTPSERKQLARSGRFVAQNPSAPKNRVSFHWNALLPPWVPWRSLVEEFINARAAARSGDLSPLKTFVNESLGESWDDALGIIEDFGFLRLRTRDYEYGESWSEEVTRFMAADKQAKGGEHYWWVVRAFGLHGKSRLIAYGRCNSTLELENIRRQYGVSTNNAIIDSGYKANEVYRFCAATGWKAFKGDDADYYLVRDEKKNKTFRQLWKWEWAQPEGEKIVGRPVRVRLFRFSNSWTKDLHAEFTTGLVGEWTLPSTIGRDYMRHATCEVREEREDSKGRRIYEWVQKHADNHLNDCELMIVVAAVITKLIVAGRPEASKG